MRISDWSSDVCSSYLLGDPLLLLVEIVDCRAVGQADVVALAVLRGGIVDLEEELQDPPVADLLGIEDDLDALGMGAVVAVGRVRHVAAGIADAGRDDAGQLADQVLHAPEAATGQNSSLGNSALGQDRKSVV